MATTHSPIAVFGVVAFYWVVSISMVFMNKYLVGNESQKYDLSVFIAWAQCMSTVLIAIGIVFVRRYLLGEQVSLPSLDRKIVLAKDSVILYFMFTAMLMFNNLCLKFVGIAFFQVARSLTLIFVVILSGLLLQKVASTKVVACCLVVVVGFALGVDQEKLAGTLSVQGVIYGVITSGFVAMNGIYTKRVLSVVNNSSFAVTYYMNFGSSLLFIPIVLVSGQLLPVWQEKATDYTFFVFLLLSGGLGFLIGFASNLQIDYTSPVTHHISNNSKSVMQTLLAVIIYQDHKSLLWWCSTVLVILGALSYTFVKMQEEKQAQLKTAVSSSVETLQTVKSEPVAEKTAVV